jgi:hypothetical protein
LRAVHCMFKIQGRELFAIGDGTIGEKLLDRVIAAQDE